MNFVIKHKTMINHYFPAMKKKISTFALALLFLIPVPGEAQGRLDRQTLLTIGDEKITVKEFMDVYQKNNTQVEAIDKKSLEEYLDLYVNFKLKVIEAENLKMDTIPAFINELEGYREQLAKPYFDDEEVSEALLHEAYERKLQDVRASHILIMLDKNAAPEDTLAARNKAMKLRERLLKGEDFGELAAEASDDPSARDREAIPNQQPFRPGNKGDLGYFSVFDMVYAFENGAYNTPIGEISMPVRSDFGYHLIKVHERSEALGNIRAAHIYVALPPDADDELVQEKEARINNIYQKITEGMRFEDAARQYSEDRGSAQNKGILNNFTVNRIVPEFVETIKTLEPGEVAAPIKTMYGYHIIRLISLDQPGSFEAEENGLRERLNRDARAKKSEEAVIAKIKKDAGFKQYDKNLHTFIALMDTSLTHGIFDATAYKDHNKPLFRLGKQRYTQADFATFMEKTHRKQSDIKPNVYAYQLFEQFVNESAIAYEDSQLEEKYPEFAMLMQEYHDGILLFDLMDKKVWSKAVRDTTGLKEFHAEHKNDYMWDERASVSLYTINRKEDVKAVQNILQSLDDDLAIREAVELDSIRGVGIQVRKFQRGDNPVVDQTGWKIGLHGPIASDVDNHTQFVRVREVLPPQPKTLNETRGLVTSDYQNHLERIWLEELRKKYPVDINQKVFENLKARY